MMSPLVDMRYTRTTLTLIRRGLNAFPMGTIVCDRSRISRFNKIGKVISRRRMRTNGIRMVTPRNFRGRTIDRGVCTNATVKQETDCRCKAVLRKDRAKSLTVNVNVKRSGNDADCVSPALRVARANRGRAVSKIRVRFRLAPNARTPTRVGF